MKAAIVALLATVFLALPNRSQSAGSDWTEAPQPPYPLRAALEGAAGEVKLHVVLDSSGRVREANVAKSSGKGVLDYAARAAVLKWRLNRSKIQPTDIQNGRYVVIEFQKSAKDRAIAQAILRKAAQKGSAWKQGGSLKYPRGAFGKELDGTVWLSFTIGSDGHPRVVRVTKSSGVPELDKAAVEGIQTWIAHREWVGESIEVPITFEKPGGKSISDSDAREADPSMFIEKPFPDYPFEARQNRWMGSGWFVLTLGADGRAQAVTVAQSTGHKVLDAAVLNAFRRWRANPKYAGQRVKIPVTFTISGTVQTKYSIGTPRLIGSESSHKR